MRDRVGGLVNCGRYCARRESVDSGDGLGGIMFGLAAASEPQFMQFIMARATIVVTILAVARGGFGRMMT